MNITFQKRPGNPTLGIRFFWRLEIKPRSPVLLTDHLIPELFLDYFFIRTGAVSRIDSPGSEVRLGRQVMRTLHTRPATLVLSTPLVLFGARLSIAFAESYWEEMKSNSFVDQHWVRGQAGSFDAFEVEITKYVRDHRQGRVPAPMLSPTLGESRWLANYSARHKRRLYRSIYGLSRKELQSIRNVHAFLEQTCDFGSQNPRIIRHVNHEVFYDQPHLNRTFRRMTGFSPVEYFEANSILQDNLLSASYNEG